MLSKLYRKALKNGQVFDRVALELNLIYRDFSYVNYKRRNLAEKLNWNMELICLRSSGESISDVQNRINCLNNPNENDARFYYSDGWHNPWMLHNICLFYNTLGEKKYDKIKYIFGQRTMTKEVFLHCIKQIIKKDLLENKLRGEELKEFKEMLKEIAETPYSFLGSVKNLDYPTKLPKGKGIIGKIEDKLISYFARRRYKFKQRDIF